MLELLEEQYNVTEAYANAQTMLWNATQRQQNHSDTMVNHAAETGGNSLPSTTLISSSVQQHYDALREVQSNLQHLQQYSDNNSNNHPGKVLQQHVALTKRVLQTLAHNPCTWQSNGLPRQHATREESISNATVAMATLKASIARTLSQWPDDNN